MQETCCGSIFVFITSLKGTPLNKIDKSDLDLIDFIVFVIVVPTTIA